LTFFRSGTLKAERQQIVAAVIPAKRSAPRVVVPAKRSASWDRKKAGAAIRYEPG